jgi:uncharacterized membrane protein YfcA
MHGTAEWLILGATAIVGSTIGGVAGFGTGVIMIPAIAWSVGVKAAVPVLTVCMLVGNSARVWFSRGEIEWRVVAAFLVGAVPMTIVGASLYTRIDSEWISRILGAFMILAVPLRRWLTHSGVNVQLRHFPLVGAGFGFLSAIVGGVGPIMTPFFLSHGLRKGRYLATDALCTVGTYITRGIMFRRADLLTTPLILVGLYIGVVMIAGAWIGRRLIDRMSEKIFLRILEILLVVFGLQFLLWPSR